MVVTFNGTELTGTHQITLTADGHNKTKASPDASRHRLGKQQENTREHNPSKNREVERGRERRTRRRCSVGEGARWEERIWEYGKICGGVCR